MKSTVVAVTLVTLVGVGGTLAYQASRARDYRELLGRGDLALSRGETFEATEAYSGAIALRPDSIIAHLRRGETYQRRGELDAAARDFRIASTLDPSAPRPLEALGDALSARGRYSRAVEAFEARLALDDASPRVAHKLALTRYRDGDAEKAIDAARHALELDSERSDTHYLLGLALRDQRDHRAAMEAFEQAVALTPGFVAAREELADLYRQSGRRADHLAQLQVLAELDRGHPGRQVAIAEALARSGQTELAILSLSEAIDRSSDKVALYAALGNIWLTLAGADGDRPDALAKALSALARGAAAAHASSAVLTLYARALLLDRQDEAAERALQQATRRFPVDPDAFGLTALMAERRQRPSAARAALVDFRALLSDEEFSRATARLGRLALRLNEPGLAALWFERAVDVQPDDVQLITELADTQLRAGHPDRARTTATRGLAQYPNHAQLSALLLRAGS